MFELGGTDAKIMRAPQIKNGNILKNISASFVLVSPAAARIIPFAVFIGFIVLQSISGEHMRSMGLDARWFYPARTVMVALLLLALWRHYTELHDFAGATGRQIGIALA